MTADEVADASAVVPGLAAATPAGAVPPAELRGDVAVDLEAIRRRADAATPGPWRVEYLGERGYPQRIVTESGLVVAQTYESGAGPRAATAEFLAHARTDVPELLAEIERLRAANASLRRNAAVLADEVIYAYAGDGDG